MDYESKCDLCAAKYNHHKEGTTTECGTSCCEACCESYVKFVHTIDEVYAFLED